MTDSDRSSDNESDSDNDRYVRAFTLLLQQNTCKFVLETFHIVNGNKIRDLLCVSYNCGHLA